MWSKNGLETIEISQRKLYDLLKPRVGKKKAKAMAYGRRVVVSRWKQLLLREMLGTSHKLTDIRLMYLFNCSLSARQKVILQDNRQKYQVKEKT